MCFCEDIILRSVFDIFALFEVARSMKLSVTILMCLFQCIIIRVMLYRMRHQYLHSMRICFQSRRSIGESTVRNPSIRAGSASTGPKGSTICIGTFCAGMLQDSVAEEDNSVKTIRKLQLILMPDQKPAGDNPKNGVKQHVKEYRNFIFKKKIDLDPL